MRHGWIKDVAGTPLWLAGIPDTPVSPLQPQHTLGWLYVVISAIAALPTSREEDVWCRLLRVVSNVKVSIGLAYIINPWIKDLHSGGLPCHPSFEPP